jgi:uncharacterized protein YcbK (DUF882 family)
MARHFSDEEVKNLDPRLVELLDFARESAGIPFVITEGYAVGGSHVGNTAHQRGKAVDIRARDGVSRFKILTALLSVGFVRLGVYNHHIHADIDATLPQNVIWCGVSK